MQRKGELGRSEKKVEGEGVGVSKSYMAVVQTPTKHLVCLALKNKLSLPRKT